MNRHTFLQVDLSAIANNARILKEQVAGTAMLMAVVKANAYGHGAVEVAQTALANGAQWLGVATVDEGLQLRRAGITAPCLVLGLADDEGIESAVRNGISLCVCTRAQLAVLGGLRSAGLSPKIHLKFDSGMGRIGLRSKEEALAYLQMARELNVEPEGLFTHFATADVPSKQAVVEQQLRLFLDVVEAFRGEGFGGIVHAAATAAAICNEGARFDMIRQGIGLYGTDISGKLGLLPALAWKTQVVFVKDIAKGDGISYGHEYVAGEGRRVATLSVGYADGYRRNMQNKAHVLIRGQRAPVLGIICMDQIVVDVTNIPGACTGDEAVLLGQQGKECISGERMAGWADTINYEIYCGISARVPRVYLR